MRADDVADGREEPLDAEHGDRDQQHGGQILADDVHDLAGTDRQDGNECEEEQAEDPGTEFREEHVSAHLKGGGAGAGDAECGADDKHDDVHAQKACAPREPAEEFAALPEPHDRENGQDREPGVGKNEAGKSRKPFCSAFQPEKGRKDKVSCAEKYGK